MRRYSTIIPIIHVQNKCDLISTEEVEVDPLLSWLGNSISISAEQELHFSNLFSSIKFVHWKWLFTTTTLNEKELETIRICLLGKTNVGKSTLINQLQQASHLKIFGKGKNMNKFFIIVNSNSLIINIRN